MQNSKAWFLPSASSHSFGEVQCTIDIRTGLYETRLLHREHSAGKKLGWEVRLEKWALKDLDWEVRGHFR